MAKITLVDDDENIVTSVSLALESHGHTVKAYYDGAAVMRQLGLAQETTAVPQLTPSTMTTAVRSSLRHAPTRPYPPADALWRSGRPGRSRLPTAFKSP